MTGYLEGRVAHREASILGRAQAKGQVDLRVVNIRDYAHDRHRTVDDAPCTRCMRCLDNLCIAIRSEQGRIIVDADRCTGCGACTIVCQTDAFRLDKRGGDHL